ncbi:MAG: dTMP kinase [Acidiferrobacteraceae bacterium]|nr:dTMP kinase [Acidiferrobacteraceae bacterium]|tara:strand:+ start:2255 stop:2902 length:648 start_codon:yes stop_codon:yes gene_type:complete
MKNSNRGCLITLEGGDGVGKTTHIELLRQYLESYGLDIIATREPGGTPFGESLRDLLLNSQLEFDAEAEMLVLFAARAEHLKRLILPAISSGKWILCDRFTDATFAYQGGGGGIPFGRIKELERFVQSTFQPDLTLLLDLPVEDGLARIANRGGNVDRFEKRDLDFKNDVRQAYLRRQEQDPGRIRLVRASNTVEKVHETIVEHVAQLLARQNII